MSDLPDGSRRVVPGQTFSLTPGFGQPWYSANSISLATGVTQTWDIAIADSDFIYYVDSISFYGPPGKGFLSEMDSNVDIVTVGSGLGFLTYNARLNPSLYFINGDHIYVKIKNMETVTLTFGYTINGTKIPRPASWGHPPLASFTALPLFGISPLSVTFTDASRYTPTSWLWDCDGLGYSESVQNPVHVYANGGKYSPKLKTTNAYGYDIQSQSNYITVLTALTCANFTKVDPNNRFSCVGSKVTITGLTRNETAYVYDDFGVAYFTSFNVIANIKATAFTGAGAYLISGLSNTLSGYLSWVAPFVIWDLYTSGSDYSINLYYVAAGGGVVSDFYVCALNTDYYIEVVHVLGSTSINMYIYSDSNYTILLHTLTVTHAGIATCSFRYFYPIVSYNDAGGTVASGYVNNIGVTQ